MSRRRKKGKFIVWFYEWLAIIVWNFINILLIILQSTQNFTSVSGHTDFEEESEIMSFIRKFSKSLTPTQSTEVPESNVPNEVTGKIRFMY